MRIAYVVPYVPNLIRTRPYNLIRQLHSLGHDIDVFTLGSGRQDVEDARVLAGKSGNVRYHVQPVWRSYLNSAAALFSGQPLQSVYSWQAGMARNLAQRVSQKEFDIVHVEHLRGSRYGVFIKEKFPGMPVVWDSVDCISHLFKQASAQSTDLFSKLVTRFELDRTRETEARLLRIFDHVLVTSATDRSALLELPANGSKPAPVSVVSNGVDQEFFHPNPDIERDSDTLVFSGKMSYHANISMIKYLIAEIMPRIWKVRRAARLLIVGKDPPPDIRELGNNPRITVTGTVNDIRPFLWQAAVSVVPLLYGAGIQNKILEAMATGTPVVTTPGALSALRARAGSDVLVAADAQEFSQVILRLMNDKNLRREIGSAGASYVAAQHSWTAIASHLVEIYQENTKLRGD
ncbi:MAG: glycosyltransferase [Chloroflexota bacterium]